MAVLTSPSCVEHFVQGHHDITKLRSGLSAHNPSADSPHRPMRGHRDTLSPASSNSTPSQRSSLIHYSQKEQISHCLEQYQALAREGLDSHSAREAAFWCCLGLGAVACSQFSPAQQAPLSAESRAGSSHSLDTVSDSGFAPSFDTGARHCLSLDDPNVENSITNLVGGLAGVFASGLLSTANGPHGLSLPDLSQDFVPVLARFSLVQNQWVENILALAAKISTQLLSVLQSDCGAPNSILNYWALCLKFVLSSSENDIPASNELRRQLLNDPPHCLTEPARSYIITIPSQGGALSLTPFPTLDSSPKSPHMATRFHHRTRSRAASLMSHTSLRSFSSVRSLGGLSAKSPATMSLSFDFGAADNASPSGSFATRSSSSALRTLDLLAENLRVRPRAREPLSPDNGHFVTVPNSPLKRTTLPRSLSNDPLNGKGKGKENAGQLPREGLRPGTANLSVRTGTRFAVTSPPTPSGLGRSALPLPKLDPVLAALEKSSKLKSKSVCLNCKKKGDNYPCCPRCGEAWCSRECRVEANKGGKHVCKRAVSVA
ncbi:unnamed protein product [Rhizoctonia solani]|uniref:HIT-type domain-containing protein n=1 Tax=Rhizoctonia solani TaxID=456999 RepID=A0A8H3CVP2_9AGAM|nr:unnamed protein product [Rhizoctonia solani]